MGQFQRVLLVGYFYPRSPCGERLINTYHRFFGEGISIHALLAESDNIINSNCNLTQKFLSTLSLRRATFLVAPGYKSFRFLSTLSLRRATKYHTGHTVTACISIHALLAESDRAASITPTASRNFYPRSPCGERPSMNIASNFKHTFLSTLSLRRATLSFSAI